MRSVFDALKGPKTPPGGPARTPPDSGPKGYHEPYDLPPGSAIASYRIIGKLGEGGMGTVYLAEHQQISRRAAIKVLHREYSQDPLFADRFLNEARAVNLIAHPGLVEIFEYGALPDGTKYIVMEYLEGELLTALMERGRQQQRRLGAFGLALARQVALALDAAHEKGIVHRDLKPDNIMVIPDRFKKIAGLAKILDFGIAKMTAAGPRAKKTRTGSLMGTLQEISDVPSVAGVVRALGAS